MDKAKVEKKKLYSTGDVAKMLGWRRARVKYHLYVSEKLSDYGVNIGHSRVFTEDELPLVKAAAEKIKVGRSVKLGGDETIAERDTAILRLRADGFTLRTIAAQYGLSSPSVVSRIVARAKARGAG